MKPSSILPYLIASLLLLPEFGCDQEDEQTQSPWQVDEAGSDMRGADLGERKDAGRARTEDMSAFDATMQASLPSIKRPACAPEGAGVGRLFAQRWETLKPEDELIVLVSDRWVPGQPLPNETRGTQAMEEEAGRRPIVLLNSPYVTFDPQVHRLIPPCSTTQPCPLLMVRLTAKTLQQWLAESCLVNHVELTGFDCPNHPESCERAASCKLVRAALAEPDDTSCSWYNVAGCQDEERSPCFDSTTCAIDGFGNRWNFSDSCLPEGGTFNEDNSCGSDSFCNTP